MWLDARTDSSSYERYFFAWTIFILKEFCNDGDAHLNDCMNEGHKNSTFAYAWRSE